MCSARRSSPRWSTWCWPPTTRARRSSAPVKISVLVALVALVDSIGGPATSLWSVPGQELDQDNRFRFFQRGNSPAPFVLPPDYVSILDKVGVAVEGQLLIKISG